MRIPSRHAVLLRIVAPLMQHTNTHKDTLSLSLSLSPSLSLSLSLSHTHTHTHTHTKSAACSTQSHTYPVAAVTIVQSTTTSSTTTAATTIYRSLLHASCVSAVTCCRVALSLVVCQVLVLARVQRVLRARTHGRVCVNGVYKTSVDVPY